MRPQHTALILPPLVATLACAASIPQISSELVPEALIPPEVDQAIVSRPNETIGDYFDRLPSRDQSTLGERSVYRTQAFTEIIWADGKTNFNISMSRCVGMSDKAGLYTAKIGNLPNATVQDIVNDLRARQGSDAANRVEYSSRVKENAELAIIAANELLAVADPNFTPISITDESYAHGELRHLLALAEMTVLIIRSSLTTEILVSFFAGIMGRIHGGTNTFGIALYAITTYSLQIVIGIHNIIEHQHVNFVTATIFTIFLSWVRDSLRVFAGEFLPEGTPNWLPSVVYDKVANGFGNNGTVRGTFPDGSKWPLAQDLMENALEALGYYGKPRSRYRPSFGFNKMPNCPSPGF